MDEKEAITSLYDWQIQGGDSFTCKLFELMMKADINNKIKLAGAFPAEAKVLNDWYSSPNPDEYFISKGYGR